MKHIATSTIAAVIILALFITLPIAATAAPVLPTVEKTDRFNILDAKNVLSMISRDGELIIHISDDTEIIFENGVGAREHLAKGKTLADLLNARKLTVSYRIVTNSFPPQAPADKIVILQNAAQPDKNDKSKTPSENADNKSSSAPPYNVDNTEQTTFKVYPSHNESISMSPSYNAGGNMTIVPPIYHFSPSELPVFD